MPRTTRRKIVKGAGAALAAGAGWLTFRPHGANAYYSGPVSDHFDGRVFYNRGHDGPRSFADLLRWNFLEKNERWPDAFPSPHPPVPDHELAKGAESGRVRIVHIGHASFLVQTHGRSILFDPVWSDRASPVSFAGPKRLNPPGLSFAALPPIDCVVVTHNHYDHMDMTTLGRLVARFRPRVITPLGNDTILREGIGRTHAGALDVRAVDWGDVIELADGLRLHTVPSLHWSARGMRDRRHALWASFVLETPAHRLYCVGDTGFGDGTVFRDVRQRFGAVDLALLPIGAYEPRWFMRAQHMNPADAVAAFELLGAKRALGHHWGTFKLTNEGIEHPARHLSTALAEKGIAPERFVALSTWRCIRSSSRSSARRRYGFAFLFKEC